MPRWVHFVMGFGNGTLYRGEGFSIVDKILGATGGDSKNQCSWWKDVWACLAPPKVEVLCWQNVLGKMVVKSELIKRGILHGVDSTCVFCNSLADGLAKAAANGEADSVEFFCLGVADCLGLGAVFSVMVGGFLSLVKAHVL
ncbi:hypothetical protein PTKIN_Ptkin16aG0010700 [Pterospermum kingtungense]